MGWIHKEKHEGTGRSALINTGAVRKGY